VTSLLLLRFSGMFAVVWWGDDLLEYVDRLV